MPIFIIHYRIIDHLVWSSRLKLYNCNVKINDHEKYNDMINPFLSHTFSGWGHKCILYEHED